MGIRCCRSLSRASRCSGGAGSCAAAGARSPACLAHPLARALADALAEGPCRPHICAHAMVSWLKLDPCWPLRRASAYFRPMARPPLGCLGGPRTPTPPRHRPRPCCALMAGPRAAPVLHCRERLSQLPDADNITIAYPDEGAWKRFHYQFGDYPEVRRRAPPPRPLAAPRPLLPQLRARARSRLGAPCPDRRAPAGRPSSL